MKKVFSRPKSLRDTETHYCLGCGHGIVHRLICEIIDELGIREKTIAVAPVGCAVIAYDYWDFDCCEAAHGRALAVGTGIKRMQPDKFVFTYQGDGDLAAIGTAETVHTANRGENLRFFVTEMSYGQMLEDVQLSVNGRSPIDFYGRSGGGIPTEEEILKRIL